MCIHFTHNLRWNYVPKNRNTVYTFRFAHKVTRKKGSSKSPWQQCALKTVSHHMYSNHLIFFLMLLSISIVFSALYSYHSLRFSRSCVYSPFFGRSVEKLQCFTHSLALSFEKCSFSQVKLPEALFLIIRMNIYESHVLFPMDV